MHSSSSLQKRIALPARLNRHRSSLLGAIKTCLETLGDHRDLQDVAGISGLAFRLQVDPQVSLASVSSFPWATELPTALSRLGYDAPYVYADDDDLRFDAKRESAVLLAVSAARSGRPSILWGVHLPEFGLVTGFDDEARALLVSGVLDGLEGTDIIPYERVGHSDVPLLFMMSPARPDDCDPPEELRALTAALRYALRLAWGIAPRIGSSSLGLAAYATWREAIDSGRIDPAGHAYVTQNVSELRALVPPFLDRAATRFENRTLAQAALAYRRTSDALLELASACPFPVPEGFGLSTSARTRQAQLLYDALTFERQAVTLLEQAIRELCRKDTRSRTEIRSADRRDLFACIHTLPVGGLAHEADELKERLAPLLDRDGGFRTKVAVIDGEEVGHVYYSDLEHSGAAIDVATGRFLYIYCTWVTPARRSLGLGKLLIEALLCEATKGSYDGILAEATSQEIFLHHRAYEALGFTQVDCLEDDVRLMYLPVSKLSVKAWLRPIACSADPKTPKAPKTPFTTIGEAHDNLTRAGAIDTPNEVCEPPPTAEGAPHELPVIIAHGRPCPLIAHSTTNLANAARTCAERGLPVLLCERNSPPHGIQVGERRLPLRYFPKDTAENALAAAAHAWNALFSQGKY